tara:strand:+ start:6255 stop:7190 length:936 start_codon:yes stop_codon:yes gene_type:complete
MAKSNRTKIESEDSKGDVKVLYLIDPDAKINKQAQLAYNRSFRDALQSGAILRQKLDDVLRDQEIWDDKKEERYNSILKTLQDNEKSIKAGGIKLSDAKDLADEMSVSRNEFRALISERTSMDSNTAEGQADNAKFNFLVFACTKDTKNQSVFSDVEDYENNSIEPFALEAARQLAERLYGLDANYETTLPENEFLKDYGFVNEDLQRVDEDGKLISADGEYIDKDGRLIEWQEDGTSVYVDGKGTRLTKDGEYDIPFSPFLDDSGDPVETPEKEDEEATAEEVEEEVAKEVTTPKKRRRSNKQKVEDSTE